MQLDALYRAFDDSSNIKYRKPGNSTPPEYVFWVLIDMVYVLRTIIRKSAIKVAKGMMARAGFLTNSNVLLFAS